jgi:[ribosomal protein S5]-alanine N-acetyltransferase
MQIMTERLVLRDFRAEDWQAVHAYQNDPRYLRYYAWTERTPEAVRDFIQMFLDHQQSEPRLKFQLVIELKGSGQLIGNCGIRMEEAGALEADIGYELDPRHWGHGYATEAARAMLSLGFNQFGLHRIWAWCIADNTGSAHVLEKVGMRLEGRMRDKEFFKGRYWDTLLYAILEDEWRALQPTAEK